MGSIVERHAKAFEPLRAILFNSMFDGNIEDENKLGGEVRGSREPSSR